MKTLNLFNAAWLFRGTLPASFFLSVNSFNRALTSFIVWENVLRRDLVSAISSSSSCVPSHHMTPLIGIGTGNSGGFPGLPVCVPRKTRGHTTRARVFLQNRMKNLATAVQVSIDTAVQHCEVKFSGRDSGVGIPEAAFTFVLGFRPSRGIVGGLAALRVHYSLVVYIAPCFCGFRRFHGRRGANKPTPSAGDDE